MLDNGTCLPDSFAARFNCSFNLTRFRKSDRHFECLTKVKNEFLLRLDDRSESLTVFDADIDAFRDDTMAEMERTTIVTSVVFGRESLSPNTFVNDDTNGVSGDVENAARFTMVESMWHTFLHGTIALNDHRSNAKVRRNGSN